MHLSDIDLCLTGTVDRSAVKPRFLGDIDKSSSSRYVQVGSMGKDFKNDLLRTIGEILKRAKISRPMSIQYIPHARVPIISFIDAQWGIECDLSVSSDNAQFKAALVRSLSSIDPRLEPLYRIIKAWAKAHNINDGSKAMFNSWCLILIFISYLQCPGCPGGAMLPPLRALFFADDEDEGNARILSPSSKYDAGAALDVARVRAIGARAEFAEKRKQSNISPPLLELFAGFVSFVLELLHQSLDNEKFFKGLEKERICIAPWTGSVTQIGPERFNGRPYTFIVEDPFDADDNVGRTLGTWKDGPQTALGFLNVVLSSTRDILKGLLIPSCRLGLSQSDLKESETRRAREALAWLYGPSFLVQVPSLCPEIFSPRLQEISIQGAKWKAVTAADLTRTKGMNPSVAIVEANDMNEEQIIRSFKSFVFQVMEEGGLRVQVQQDYSPLPDLILTPRALNHDASQNLKIGKLSVAELELERARQKERHRQKEKEKRDRQRNGNGLDPPVPPQSTQGPGGSRQRQGPRKGPGQEGSRPGPHPLAASLASSMDATSVASQAAVGAALRPASGVEMALTGLALS